MKEFVFNEHSVCLNPNITEVLNEKHFKATVETAEKDGKWYYGYNWTNSLHGYSGVGCGVHFGKNSTAFEEEDDAIRYSVKHNIISALKEILSELPNASPEYDEDGNPIKINKSEKISVCNYYIDRCNEFISNTYQLSLF